MLDSLYGNLLGGPPAGPDLPPGPTIEESVESTAAALAGGAPAGGARSNGKEADDIFAEPPVRDVPQQEEVQASGVGTAAAVALGGSSLAAGPQAQQSIKEPSNAPLPQSFSAAKLMMPPVRKRAEPVGGKRVMPALDLHKLQEEKEALLRQRASAEKKDDGGKTAASPGSMGATSGGASPAVGSMVGPVVPASGSNVESTEDDGNAAPATGSTASAGPNSASTVGISSASSLYGSPDEEYDPAKPNDYDDFCRRRMRQKAEEEMERRRQEALTRQQAAKPPEPKEDDFATRMMKKMGWKEGQGMGKEGQGIAAPLVMKKVDRATGVITEGQKREAMQPAQGQPSTKSAKPAEEAKKAQSVRPPARVLLLNNLVGAGEVDEDLESETAEEAGKYGKLKKCVIKEIKGVPDDQAVRIFLEYEKVEDATKALVDMNGRYFGGRVVRARFFDERRFEKGDLEKRDDE